MGRYTKYHSNWLLRKRHQSIKGGTIIERDWVTLGERLRFGPGKRAIYSDGNFIFTESNVAPYPKRRKNSTSTEVYTYDDVEYSDNEVNAIVPSIATNDIRTFCYYGSCVELVRASIEAIIAEFPACITQGTSELTYYDEETSEYVTVGEGYIINNPFNIDLHHEGVVLGKYDNPYRFLTATWEDYSVNGSAITSYVVENVADCGDLCECQYDRYKKPVVEITITTEDDAIYQLEGYVVNTSIVFLYNGETLLIKPNDDVIEDYFNKIRGFEKQLLNRKSQPLYQNTFITPIMGQLNYRYVERDYTWPVMTGTDYCIDIDSLAYENYVNSLTNLATLMDEIWTDNLYRNMTHEAIKNFDWTYTREYVEGDEQDNVDGGERMKKILHIAARLMDDSKRYIDTIGLMNKISYDGYNNMPSAVISDKLGYSGWDITSTIPIVTTDDNGDALTLENYIVEKDLNWYNTVNPGEITTSTTDIDFCRRLLLSSAHIWRTKGTKHAIEMIMGMFGFGIDTDYTLTEQYHTVVPKPSDTEINIKDDEGTVIYTTTLYDALTDVNLHKNLALGDDDFSGLPVTEKIERNYGVDDNGDNAIIEESWIIPYLDQSKYDNDEFYDGDLYFQQAGGWGKTLGTDEDEWTLKDANEYEEWKDDPNKSTDPPYYEKELLSHINFKETLSYLHIVSTIADLLNVNSLTVNGGDIYYVVNISDFESYYEADDATEYDPDAVTHFFMYRYNSYDASVYSSWMNVSLTPDKNEYDANIAAKAEYLDSIINTAFGNNPHTGYGNYDFGVTYLQYLQKPFKYSLDNNTITGRNSSDILYSQIAEEIGFEISDVQNTDDKIFNRTRVDEQKGGIEGTSETELQVINTKILIFENKLSDPSGLYQDYFMNVIMPYLMQVIPSTTIFLLKGFQANT